MNTAIAWLVSFIVTFAPTTSQHQTFKEAQETEDEIIARYNSIAEDIVAVVWNPDYTPLFGGPQARVRSALFVESNMLYESSFRKDVDFGLGKAGKGDGGKSWCLMQAMITAKSGKTSTWNRVKNRFKRDGDAQSDLVEGWTGQELLADRKKCIEAGYRVMHESFAACANLPLQDRLRAYTSGNCKDDGGGAEKSHMRVNTALNWFARNKPTFKDDDVQLPTPEAKLAKD